MILFNYAIVRGLFPFLLFFLVAFNSKAGNFTWTGNTSESWSTTTNWTLTSGSDTDGIPDANDNVTVTASAVRMINMNDSRTITNLTMTGGQLNINAGHSLTCTGPVVLDDGTISGYGTFIAGTSSTHVSSVSFGTSTDGPRITSIATIHTDALILLNTHFGSVPADPVIIKVYNTSANINSGGNLVECPLTIESAGSGNLAMSNTAASTYNDQVTFINSGSGNLYIGYTHGDTYNSTSTVTFTNTGTGGIYPSYSGTTTYNREVILRSTNGAGILFGNNGGTSTLSSGKIIRAGNSPGFSAGTLQLKNFTQSGTSPAIGLTLTGTAKLVYGSGTAFNAPHTGTAPQVELNGTTFASTANPTSITKNGATNNLSTGGNTFNAPVTIINSSTASFRLADVTPDVFNHNVTFTNSGSSTLLPAYNGSSTFKGNISSSGTVSLGSGNGIALLDGTSTQSIDGSGTLTIARLTNNKSNSNITVTRAIIISHNLTFGGGITSKINNTSNLVTFQDGATVTNAGSTAFITGIVKKIGNDEFVFPIGKNNYYRPLAITAPAQVTDEFTSEYFNSTPPNSGNVSGFALVNCEYWNLQRTVGASDVKVTLDWNSTTCQPIETTLLKLVRYNTATNAWVTEAATITGTNASGSMQSTNNLSNPGNIALAHQCTSIVFNLPATVCTASLPLTLSAIPAGGVFSGTGVSGNQFSVSNTGTYSITYTAPSNVCVTQPSVSHNIAVSTSITPAVTIAQSPSGIQCVGTNLTFSVSNSNVTLNTYAWYVNSIQQSGQTSASFSSSALVDGDVVRLQGTTSDVCAASGSFTSNNLVVDINSPAAPAVSISQNPATDACFGFPLTLTATSAYLGTTNNFDWYVNDVLQPSHLSPFISSSLVDGDLVKVTVTSNAPCITTNTFTSQVIELDIRMVRKKPILEMESNPDLPVTNGTSVTFDTDYTEAGNNPTIAWYKNGTLQAGATSNSFTTSVSSHDVIYYTLTPDPNQCVEEGTKVSPSAVNINSINYAGLEENLNATIYSTVKGKLYFKYFEKYKNGSLIYKIIDKTNSPAIPVVNLPVLSKSSGENYFDLDLFSSALTEGETYILEVENDKKKKSYLRFIFKR